MSFRCLFLIPAMLLSTTVVLAGDSSAERTAPQMELTNGLVRLTVLLPDAEKGYYRGTRFDWSGIILRATYKGHVFFGPWKTTHDPLSHDDVAGPAEEFGMQVPLGFEEAKPGGSFLKIGVGELALTKLHKYEFWQNYKMVRAGAWHIRSGVDWIEFQQNVRNAAGLGYSYSKRIELREKLPSFVIRHRLKNIGARAFSSDHYCHNFMMIDDRAINSDYQLTFPFDAGIKPNADLQGVAHTNGKTIQILRKISSTEGRLLLLTGLTGSATDNQVTVSNTATHASLRIKGDRPLEKFNVYLAELAICPEPFIQLSLQPEQTATWSNEYTLNVLE